MWKKFKGMFVKGDGSMNMPAIIGGGGALAAGMMLGLGPLAAVALGVGGLFIGSRVSDVQQHSQGGDQQGGEPAMQTSDTVMGHETGIMPPQGLPTISGNKVTKR